MNTVPPVKLIALVGSPNSGKTSLFNALTGSRQHVANYAGVTVERKEGVMIAEDGRSLPILDLPGIYGTYPHSEDERVTWDVLTGQREDQPIPNLIVIVEDAAHLDGAISLALDVQKTTIPAILVLNKMDVALRRGLDLDLNLLSQKLGMPVLPAVAIKPETLGDVRKTIVRELDRSEPKASCACILCPSASQCAANFPQLRETRRNAKAILAAALRQKPEPSYRTQKADQILLHPVWGLSLLFLLMFVMFQAVFIWAEAPMSWIDAGVSALRDFAVAHMDPGLSHSFVADGVISGVGSVIAFMPQILILYAFILVLEDSGYLARAAFLLDGLMGHIGLPGRAFIPLLSSFACAVPGILSARTIESRRDRLMTILIAPLMTCSARLPVYALLIAAFIPHRDVAGIFNLQGLVMFALYAAGIAMGALVSFILKKTILKGETAPLLMEMPDYQIPRLYNLALGLWERARLFLMRAGTIIFFLSIMIWFFVNWPAPPEGATGTAISYSFAGRIGHFLEPLFAPLGFDWTVVVSLIPAMMAREVFVSSLATVYAVSGDATGSLSEILHNTWSLPVALSVLAWFVIAPQCVATLAVMRRETGSRTLTFVSMVTFFVLAWIASFIVYHLAQ